MSPRALSLHLLPILLLLLLELPEVGLDGAGCFLHFNGAERRNWRGARPVAGVGVWAGQKTGDSRRGRGNSHAGKVCSNDWFSNTRCTLKPPFKLAFFLFLLFWSISGFDFTLDVSNPVREIICSDMGEHTYTFCTPLCCSSWGHQTAKRTQQPSVK